MSKRLMLEIPNLSDIYARILLDEALGVIEDGQMWSFQCGEGNWITPGLLFPSNQRAIANSAGTVTARIGSNQIIGDLTASLAWANYMAAPPVPTSPLTVCQFRSPYYSLYNIMQYDPAVNAPFGTLTLDRPWGEPDGPFLQYMIYQAYFAAPVTQVTNTGILQSTVLNFKRWLNIRDTTLNYVLDYWSLNQQDLAFRDPQRIIFTNPAYVVPYKIDTRKFSPFQGNMLYELWPHPLTILPYTYRYVYRGPRLQNPSDNVPYPLTEEVVIEQARVQAYLFKEANKGENVERGAGADFRFLAQTAQAVCDRKLKPIKITDAGLMEMYMNLFRGEVGSPGQSEGFATTMNGLNIGRM